MNGTAAQPIWDDAWAAWLVHDAAQPSGWLIWNDAQSSWQPVPVPDAAPVEAARVEAAPVIVETAAPSEAIAATHLHANGPLRSEPNGPTAPGPSHAEPAPHPSAAGPTEPEVTIPAAPAPVPPLASGPFVHPAAAQLIAAPQPRHPGGGNAVLALGLAAVGVGALVTLIGLVSPVLFSVGVGEPRAVAATVNVLAVLVLPVAVAGAVLGALQLRGGAGPGRDRALIGLGVSGTVALLLLSRGLIAVVNWAAFGAPLV